MITVIIPAYNVEQFIARSIRSACQLPQVSKVIVVDDYSDDNSYIIAQEMSKEEEKLVVMRHDGHQNKGSSVARNYGISKCDTRYVAFLDADDYYLVNRFDDTLDLMQREYIDGVYEAIGIEFTQLSARKNYTDIHGEPKVTMTRINIEPENLFWKLIEGKSGYFSVNGLTLKTKSVQGSICFDTSLRMGEDTDFIWTLSLHCKIAGGSLTKPVAIRNVHGNNQILDSYQAEFWREKLLLKWIDIKINQDLEKGVGYHLMKRLVVTRLKKEGKKINKINKIKGVLNTINQNPEYLKLLFS